MTLNVRGPALTVDVIAIRDDRVLLVRRGSPPFAGAWALPGGFVEYGETVEAAARREAQEETGLEVELLGLVGVYSAPDRDPRGHTASVAFLARPRDATRADDLHADTDAADAAWHPLDNLPPLAFDHAQILHDARRLRV